MYPEKGKKLETFHQNDFRLFNFELKPQIFFVILAKGNYGENC